MFEILGSLLTLLYKTTLDKYPGTTILMSLIFILIGGIYYFVFRMLPQRNCLFLGPYYPRTLDSVYPYPALFTVAPVAAVCPALFFAAAVPYP